MRSAYSDFPLVSLPNPEFIGAVYDEILQHAEEMDPKECCGIVCVVKGKARYIRITNISKDNSEFIMDPTEYADVCDTMLDEMVCIVHSHPTELPNPTQADIVGCEGSQLPWYIINPKTREDFYFQPTGFKINLKGRTWCYGVLDCYTIIQDYYADLGITLERWPTPPNWWDDPSSPDYYVEWYPRVGFRRLDDVSELEPHDIILMQFGKYNKFCHAAIYVGDNKILHHPIGRLSGVDAYNGTWRKVSGIFLRHTELDTRKTEAAAAAKTEEENVNQDG